MKCLVFDKYTVQLYFIECAKHCSMCYNETECYECTQGYFLTEIGECQSKLKHWTNKVWLFQCPYL